MSGPAVLVYCGTSQQKSSGRVCCHEDHDDAGLRPHIAVRRRVQSLAPACGACDVEPVARSAVQKTYIWPFQITTGAHHLSRGCYSWTAHQLIASSPHAITHLPSAASMPAAVNMAEVSGDSVALTPPTTTPPSARAMRSRAAWVATKDDEHAVSAHANMRGLQHTPGIISMRLMRILQQGHDLG